MYYYVYDDFVQSPKFERDLSQIETRLTDLGISGKVARLALFRDPKELIRDEIRKGATTVVAFGNDATLRKVIDAVAGMDVVVGLIPFGKEQNSIAEMIGMPMGVEACDVLSARILQELDIGTVNGKRFLHSVSFTRISDILITCNEQFDITPYRSCDVEVRNLAFEEEDVPAANPTDGRLELIVRVPQKRWFGGKKLTTTVIPIERVRVKAEHAVQGIADGEVFQGNEFLFDVVPNQVRIITGRERKF